MDNIINHSTLDNHVTISLTRSLDDSDFIPSDYGVVE